MGDAAKSEEMNYIINHCHCKQGFEEWEGVFNNYYDYTKRFLRVYNNEYEYPDAPYWHNERANIGILASACWANGWVALEEFSAEKNNSDNKEKNKSGRCDLWVCSPDGRNNYAIEAKKGHCPLDSANPSSNLEPLLKAACEDAKQLINEGEVHLGVSIMHLYLHKDRMAEYDTFVRNLVMDMVKYKSINNLDFLYIYMEKNGVESDKYLIPGVVVAGKAVA